MIYDDNRGRDQQDITELLDGMFWGKKIPNFRLVEDSGSCDLSASAIARYATANRISVALSGQIISDFRFLTDEMRPNRRVESIAQQKELNKLRLEVIASLTGWEFILEALSVAGL